MKKVPKKVKLIVLFTLLTVGILPTSVIADEIMNADNKILQTNANINFGSLEDGEYIGVANPIVLHKNKEVQNSDLTNSELYLFNKEGYTLEISDDSVAEINNTDEIGNIIVADMSVVGDNYEENFTLPIVVEGDNVVVGTEGALLVKDLALSDDVEYDENTLLSKLKDNSLYFDFVKNDFSNESIIVANNSDNEFKITVPDSGIEFVYETKVEKKADAKASSYTLHSQETILAEGFNNPDKSVTMAQENYDSLKNDPATKTIVVTTPEEFKAALKDTSSVVLVKVQGSIEVGFASVLPKNTVFLVEGADENSKITTKGVGGMVRVYDNSSLYWNIDIKGVLPENAFETDAFKGSSVSLFQVNGQDSVVNLMPGINVSDFYVGTHGGVIATNHRGSTANVYGGNYENIGVYGDAAGIIGIMFDIEHGQFNQYGGKIHRVKSGIEGIYDFYDYNQQTAHMFKGEVTNTTSPKSTYSFTSTPSTRWDGYSEPSFYWGGQFKMHDNWMVAAGSNSAKLQPNNLGLWWFSPYIPASTNYGMYNNVLNNLTPDSNIGLGSTFNDDMDKNFARAIAQDTVCPPVANGCASGTSRPNPFKGIGIPLAIIEYSDPELATLYEGNGIVEGATADWAVAGTPISTDGKYSVIELQDPHTKRYHAVLVRTATSIEVSNYYVQTGELIPADMIDGAKNPYIVTTANNGVLSITPKKVANHKVSHVELATDVDKATTMEIIKDADGFITKIEINPNNTNIDGVIWEEAIKVYYTLTDLKAEDTTIKESIAPTVTAENIIELMQAEVAGDIAGEKINVVADFTAINAGKKGDAFEVTFSVTLPTGQVLEKTVTLTIIGDNATPDGKGEVNANDATIYSKDAKKATLDKLKEIMGASAEYNGEPVTDIQVSAELAEINKGEVGTTHNVTFIIKPATGQEATITVKLTVIADNATPDGKGEVNAKDATIYSKDAKTTTLDKIKEIMGASAEYNGAPVTDIKVTTDLAKINEGEVGSMHNVTFIIKPATEQEATITVKLTVIADNATPDGKGEVNANDATIYSSDAKTATLDELETLMGANGKYSDPVAIVDIKVTTDLAEINKGEVGSVHNVTFTIEPIPGQIATIAVKLTVIADNATPDGKGQVNAKDATIYSADAKKATLDKLKEIMDASATYNEAPVTDIKVTTDLAEINKGVVGSTHEVTFTIEPATGQTATITVNLTVIADNSTPDGKGQVNASDASIHSSDAKTATLDKLKEIMEASATYNESRVTDIKVTTDLAEINKGVVGSEHFVTFTIEPATGQKATITVKLTVIADNITPDGQGQVNANNATIKSTIAKTTTLDDLKTIMGATANYEEVVAPIVVEADLDEINKGVVGSKHNVTFKIWPNFGQTASITVELYVIDDDAVVTPDGKGHVYAKNALVTSSEAKDIANIEALIATMSASAAYDGLTIIPTVTANEWASIKAGTIGIYDISFSITDGEGITKTVKLTVVEDDAVITPDEKGSVYAMNKQITSKEAKAIANLEALIATMKATANYEGVKVTPNVTAEEFAQIQAGIVGIYDVTFSITDGEGASKTVKLTVIEDDAVITPDEKGSVYASNMQITSKEAKAIANLEALITTMEARANYDGAEVTPNVTAEEFAQIQAGIVDIYDVTFSITEGGGASKTVKLTVIEDDAVVTPDGKGSVYAKDTQITSKKAKEIASLEALVEIMNARANYDGVEVTPSVTAEEFAQIQQGINGVYDVTFSITKGDQTASITVKLTVVGDNITPDGKGEVNASDATIHSSVAKKTTLEELIAIMDANATYNDAAVTDIKVTTNLDKINEGVVGSTHEVTFTIEPSTGQTATITVTLTVIADNITPDLNGVVNANDATIHSSDAKTATLDKLKEIMGANATYNDAAVTDIKVITELDKINEGVVGSTHEVTFTIEPSTGQKATITVTLTVIADNATPDGKGQVIANDATIQSSKAKTTTLDELIAIMGAEASYNDAAFTDIKVNTKLAEINKGEIGSTHKVTFTIEPITGQTAQITVTLTVIADNITPDLNGVVNANDATIHSSVAKTATLDKLKEIMGAKATYNDAAFTDIKVITDLAEINKGEIGSTHKVEFTIEPITGQKATITVTLTVIDDNITPDGKGEVNANDATIQSSVAKTTKLEELIAIMGANASYDGADITDIKVITNLAEINKGVVGSTHEVTFTIEPITGQTATITVTLTVTDDNITPDGKGEVNASDATIHSSDAKTATLDKLKEIMDANATYDGANVTDIKVITDLAEINKGEVGSKHTVTFTIEPSTGQKATITVTLTVIADNITPDGKGQVNANNATIKSTLAKTTTLEDLVKIMGASATYNEDAVTNIKVITDLAEINKGVVGSTHEVTFTIEPITGQTATITVELYVIDDDAVITPDGKGHVYAKNALVTSSEAKEIPSIEALIGTMSASAAYDGLTIIPTVTANEWASIKAGTIGIYDISFSITDGEGATKTVKLTVVEDDAVITPDEKGSVYAMNKQITSKEAKAIANLEALIATMKATANYDGVEVTPNVTAEEFAQIQAGIVGIYDVTFSITDGEGASKTVKLTVIEDDAVVTPDEKGSVYASNMQITSKEAKAIANLEALIATMEARANYDGIKVTPSVTAEEFAQIQAGIVDIYDVTFSITEGGGASKTVKLTVIEDDAVVTPDEKGSVYAKDTQITSKKATEIANLEALVEIMNARANYDGVEVTPNVTAEEFAQIQQGIIGVYDVTFSITKGDQTASITVKLTVVGDNITPDGKGEVIASDATIHSSVAKKTTLEELIAIMGAEATYDGAAVTDIKVITDLAKINEGVVGSTHEVTFTIEPSTGQTATITVTLTVIADNVTPDGKGEVIANDATIQSSVAKTTKLEELIAIMGAKATYNDAAVTDIKVITELAKINEGVVGSTHEVTFTIEPTTGQTATITVTLTVIADNITPDGKGQVIANDATIHSTVAKTATLDKLKEIMGAKATYNDAPVTDIKVITDLAKINEGEIGSTHEVTFTIEPSTGQTATITVTLTVIGDNTTPDGKGQVIASDATIHSSVAKTTKLEELIAIMGASATYDGAAVTDIEVITELAKINEGVVGSTHKVTFMIEPITGQKATITVTLTVIADNITPDGNGKVIANDATIQSTVAKTTTLQDLLEIMGAKATYNDAPVTDIKVIADLAKINEGEIGSTHEVTFTIEPITGQTASITVILTVTGDNVTPDGKGQVIASDATIHSSVAKTTKLEELIAIMGAKATYDGADIADIKVITELAKINEGVIGSTHEVTFTIEPITGQKATITVTLTVIADNVTPDGNGKVIANDATIQSTVAKTTTLQDLLEIMGASATYNEAPVTDIKVNTELAKINEGVIGSTHEVTFTIEPITGQKATITVTLTVIADNITPDGKGQVNANDATIHSTVAKTATIEDLLAIMGAKATYNDAAFTDIKVNTELAKINEGVIGSTHEVTFTIEPITGQTATITVTLTVIADNITPDGKGQVNANDATIHSTVAKTATIEDLLEIMGAKATYDGADITDIKVITELAKINEGVIGSTHEVTFTIEPITGQKATITVTLTVIGDNVTPDGKGEVKANDAKIQSSVAKTTTLEDLIAIMGAKATYDGAAVTDIKVITELAKINEGVIGSTHEVTFMIEPITGQKATITVTLTVIGDNVTPDGKGQVIANDATIHSTDAKTTTLQDLLEIMGAKATYDDAAFTDIKVITELAEINKGIVGSTHNVTFTIQPIDGQKATITVVLSVIEDDAVITPDGKGYVYAEDTQITSSKAKEITNMEELIEIMKAKANYDGEIINPSVTVPDFGNLQAGVPGVYEVIFSITENGKTTSITVNLTVVGDNITPDGKGQVNANNAIIHSSVAKTTTLEDLVTIMGAKASYDGAAFTDIKVVTDLTEINKGIVGSKHNVTFTIQPIDGQSATITVELNVIKDDAVITPDGKHYVHAVDKTITVSQAKKLNLEDNLIELMEATGYHEGSPVVPTVEATEFNVIKTGKIGTYDVAFSINKGEVVRATSSENAATTNVKLNVVKDNTVVTPDVDDNIVTPELEDTGVLSKVGIYVSTLVILVCAYIMKKRKLS